MQKVSSFDEYVEKHPEWASTLSTLRGVLQSCGLVETIKWGIPTYTLDGKNVVGLAAFKHHAALWFIQGALLDDPEGKLINAQHGKTRAQRQWRFAADDKIDKALVKRYVKEAMANQQAGREVEKRKLNGAGTQLPDELSQAFSAQPDLAAAYAALSDSKQREYAEFIGDARRESTRNRRLQKIVPLILSGQGLNDRYR